MEQHAVLIGLTGKYLEKYAGSDGLDLFVNSIVKYGKQRGKRMKSRALRDGRPLNYETFLAYGELKLDTLPGDYSVGANSPVYINCCHRCMWDEAWRKFGLLKYGQWYCRYIDLHLVQGFSDDMVMLVKTMKGLGDDFCTFVHVGYEQTEESRERIARLKAELNGRYLKDFLYHEGHFLNAVRSVCRRPLKEKYEKLETDILREFSDIYDEKLAEKVKEEAGKNFDEF